MGIEKEFREGLYGFILFIVWGYSYIGVSGEMFRINVKVGREVINLL